MWRIGAVFGLLMVVISGCAPAPTLQPGEPCPVTAAVPEFIPGGAIGSLAGQSPAWMVLPENGHVSGGPFTGSLAPYPGWPTKQLLTIADDFHGKIKLSAVQMDGKGKVLFPNDNSWEWVSDTTGVYHEKPAATLTIDTASQNHKITSPKPEGYTYYGFSLIYPHPGCFRFTLSDGSNSVEVVLEVKE